MFQSIRTGRAKTAVTAVGIPADTKRLPRSLADLDVKGALKAALSTPGFKAEPGEVVPAGDAFVLVGLGAKDSIDRDRLRTVGAKLVGALDRMEVKAVRLAVGRTIPARTADADTIGQTLAEGMGLANWRVDFFDGKATKTPKALGTLTIVPHEGATKRGIDRGLALAESANYARRLGATPPNIANPTFMAKEARSMARKTGLTCKVVSYAQAQQMGMGGLVNVGKASATKPCLIVLEHKPTKISKAARGKKIALVGKTITYDTGGYSLKISNGMKGMKYDKNGGMAVLGAMHAIATLGLPVHVVGLLPCAENMVSGEAYRPDDIITMMNGVTVEVTNTDAEGRLVLADALHYACSKVKATEIIDMATLTGGVIVALGSWSAGLWTRDDAFEKRLQAAADVSGERLWRLPLWEEHRDFMRAKHADVWNSGPKRDAHPIQGAAFLSFFVDEDIPWAHIDIAGTSTTDGSDLHTVTGPTGYGVRLATEYVASQA